MKKTSFIQSIIFLVFIAGFFLLGLFLPDRTFSEQENKSLQTMPNFSLSSLFSGKFTEKFESYITDQFPMRDSWISLKARTELLLGKKQNNGVYLCEGERLIEPFTAPEESDFYDTVGAVEAFSESVDIPVYFALIPTASEIYADLLPQGAPNDSESELISKAYSSAPSAISVDITSSIAGHSDESIYYRTDHHWTTLGAYYGYTALSEAMNFSPVPLSEYTPTVISDSFYGTAYSSSGITWIEPDSITTYVESDSEIITNYSDGTPQPGVLYDESYLDKKDKYSCFYGGNTPLITIETGNSGQPSLLIIRDSYTDSLSPFLFPHFSEIHIMDLRYYRKSVHDYIKEHNFDSVLICYSVANFVTDTNIVMLEN